jgi:hypothetical protein
MSKAKKGVYAAAITPIMVDGEPDLQGLIAYCQHLLATHSLLKAEMERLDIIGWARAAA